MIAWDETDELSQTLADAREERRRLLRAIRNSEDLSPAACERMRREAYSVRREMRDAHKRLAGIETGK